MKKLFVVGVTALGLLPVATPSQAQTAVGVQFSAYYGSAGDNLNGGYSNYPTGYYAGAYLQQYWNVANNSTGTGNGVPSDPITNASLINGSNNSPVTTTYDSTGATSSLTFSLSGMVDNRYSAGGGSFPNLNDGSTGEYSQFNPNGNLSLFLQGGVEAVDGSGSLTLTLGGLNPTTNYDLYVYVSSLNFAGSQSASVTFNGTTYYLATDGGTLTGLTQSSDTTGSSGAPTADYVEFTNVSGAQLNADAVSESGAYTGLSGFQVVTASSSAVPEPSTVWLGVLGFLGLAVHLRRRRLAQI